MLERLKSRFSYLFWRLIENYRISRDVGFVFWIKYKLGLARPGIDFIDVGQEDLNES